MRCHHRPVANLELKGLSSSESYWWLVFSQKEWLLYKKSKVPIKLLFINITLDFIYTPAKNLSYPPRNHIGDLSSPNHNYRFIFNHLFLQFYKRGIVDRQKLLGISLFWNCSQHIIYQLLHVMITDAGYYLYFYKKEFLIATTVDTSRKKDVRFQCLIVAIP